MTVTRYTWDPVFDAIVKEEDVIGATTAEYNYEPVQYGRLISQNRDGATSYYHYDALGSTNALTDTNGLTQVFEYAITRISDGARGGYDSSLTWDVIAKLDEPQSRRAIAAIADAVSSAPTSTRNMAAVSAVQSLSIKTLARSPAGIELLHHFVEAADPLSIPQAVPFHERQELIERARKVLASQRELVDLRIGAAMFLMEEGARNRREARRLLKSLPPRESHDLIARIAKSGLRKRRDLRWTIDLLKCGPDVSMFFLDSAAIVELESLYK